MKRSAGTQVAVDHNTGVACKCSRLDILRQHYDVACGLDMGVGRQADLFGPEQQVDATQVEAGCDVDAVSTGRTLDDQRSHVQVEHEVQCAAETECSDRALRDIEHLVSVAKPDHMRRERLQLKCGVGVGGT